MLKQFTKYVLQSVAGMVGISVYILADTFFISLYSGADGLAVLNLILPVFGLVYAIGAMIGIGSATRYRISKAKGEPVDFYFTQSVLCSVLCSIPFILIGIFLPEKLLQLLGGDAALTALGKDYLRIILIASPFFMTNYTFTAFTRNDHAPATAMLGSIAGSLFNIVFDYVFMFPMGLGMNGAALATAVCPAVTMSVCCMHLFGKNNHVEFGFRRPSLRHLFSCCQLGISAFVGEISSAVTTIVFNMLILSLAGNIGVAAYGVIANISIVAMSIFNGLAQGAQPLISEYYGKGDTAHVKKLLKWSLLTGLATEIIIVGTVFLATGPLISIFNSEQSAELARYADDGIRLYFLGYLVAGINIVLVAYFSAVDKPRPAITGSLLRGVVAIIFFAILLSALFGMTGIWLSFPCAEVLTFAVVLVLSRVK